MHHEATPSDSCMGEQASQAQLLAVVARQPYPLLFMTISGAHLYGFPSVDSDYDLRGVHVLPLREVIGLQTCGAARTVGAPPPGAVAAGIPGLQG